MVSYVVSDEEGARLAKLPVREKVVAPPRKPLTKAERAKVFAEADGRCHLCGEKIAGPWEDDHVLALKLGGSNDLSNRRPAHPACHKAKTAGKDVPAIAKAKRLAGETCTGPKVKITSRGFDKTRSRKFDGSIRLRPNPPGADRDE